MTPPFGVMSASAVTIAGCLPPDLMRSACLTAGACRRVLVIPDGDRVKASSTWHALQRYASRVYICWETSRDIRNQAISAAGHRGDIVHRRESARDAVAGARAVQQRAVRRHDRRGSDGECDA